MINKIEEQLISYKNSGKKLFTTSSFQTHSTVLLHIISRIDKTIPVYCLNTGYLFGETLEYRNTISSAFGLNVITINPEVPKSLQKDYEGRLLFVADPDRCCHYNKVMPMEPLLVDHDVWINGVRADQSSVRKAMKTEQKAKHGCLRYHPMLEWTNKMIFDYIKEFDLPKHPLDARGYTSIGCEPCTRRPTLEMMERESRWYGQNKVECGLHTELIEK